MAKTLIQRRDQFSTAYPEKRLRINGREWGMTRIGEDGPALVLIPGTLGRGDIFFQQMLALKLRARLLAVTYPSSGGIVDWAADIIGLIRAEGMQNAVVLGSSLGGYLAQYIAAIYPADISGLIAANTLVSVDGIDRMMPYALDLINTPIAPLRQGFSDGLKGWTGPDHPYAELAALLLAEVEGRIPEAELRARLNAMKMAPSLPKQSLTKRLISIVESGDDHLINPAMQMALKTTLPHGRCFTFDWGSHFPYVTRPDDYTAMLMEVLGLSKPGDHWPRGVATRL